MKMGVSLQYFAAISSSLGALAAGTALGWSGNLEQKIRTDLEYGFEVSDSEWAMCGSALNVGAACVCILTGVIMNIIGRRQTLLCIVVPFVIGWIMLIFASSTVVLIAGRAIIGIGCGGICVVGPAYCGEIAEKSIRGRLGSFFQLQITIGIFFVYILGAFVSAKATCIICGLIPIAFAVCIFFCPESPTFHIMQGKEDEAVRSLRAFRGMDFNPEEIIKELKEEEHERQSRNVRAAMMKTSSKRAMMISFSLMFFQQLSGINTIIFYISQIFKEANIQFDIAVAGIIVGFVQVVATFVATATIEKLGRKLLLIISDSVMAFSTLVLAIFYVVKENDPDGALSVSWISILACCVFIIAFSLGFGPVPWLMMGEIFSSDVKGIAGSLTGTLNWTLAFIVTMSYTPLSDKIGPGPCFFIFTAISIIGTLFSAFIVKETKGKSLAEIQAMMGER